MSTQCRQRSKSKGSNQSGKNQVENDKIKLIDEGVQIDENEQQLLNDE